MIVGFTINESPHAARIGCIFINGMKSLPLLPLTFIAGMHGFAMFAPYVLLMLAIE